MQNNTLNKSIFSLLICCLFLNFNQVSAQEKLHLENFEAIPSNTKILDIIVKTNATWIATNKGLYEIDNKTNDVTAHFDRKSIETILFLSPKRFIIANKHRIIDQNSKLLYKFDSNIQIYKMIMRNKQLWVSTNNGIYTIKSRDYGLIKHYNADNSKLASNNITAMHLDKQNNMWIGSDRGTVRVHNDKWKLYDKKIATYSITENKEGVWLMNEEDLWRIDPDDRWYPIGIDNGLKKGKVNSISINKKGKLYFASEILVGLNPYLDQTNNLGNEISLLSKQVTIAQFDLDDHLWVGTKQSGLFRLTIEKLKKSKLKKAKTEEEVAAVDKLKALILITSDIACSDSENGAIEVQVRGGVLPYSYQWNYVGASSPTLTNLAQGDYEVTITDAANTSIISKTKLYAPQPISLEIIEQKPATSSTINDGMLAIEITGGTPSYDISWDGQNGTTSKTRLSLGNHIVAVKDQFGCSTSLNFEIIEPKILPNLVLSNLSIGQTLPIKQLYFAADSTEVKTQSFEVLDEIYVFLTTNQSVRIEIGGHTNNIPPHDYCDKLSKERANQVSNYLTSKGIPKSRIEFRGYGKRVPIASNKTSGGRKKNQRVELKILSL